MKTQRTWPLIIVGVFLLLAPAWAWAATDEDDEMDDMLLGLKVHMALLQHLGFDALDIDVETTESHVRLNGEVKDRAAQETAEEIAAAVEGVASVSNQLMLEERTDYDDDTPVADALEEGGLEVQDAFLELKTKSMLIAELGRHGFGIEVEATSGTVSLAGDVPDQRYYELAADIAKKIEGTEKVVNLLKVRS